MLITLPNGAGGVGRYLPAMVVVALGAPGGWASADTRLITAQATSNTRTIDLWITCMSSLLLHLSHGLDELETAQAADFVRQLS